jgi:hypothetical protein
VRRACAMIPASPPPDDSAVESDAAHDANKPLPQRSRIVLEPDYTFHAGGGYTIETKVQPTLRYEGFFIPGLVVPGIFSFARPQIYARSVNDPKSDVHATGVTDLLFVNGIAHNFVPELGMSIGYSMTLPVATSSGLDKQQWQLGPALFVMFVPSEALQLSVLVEDFFTIARQPGSSYYAYVTVQPQLSWHFTKSVFFSSDATMSFDFTGNSRTDVPVNLGIGKAFGGSFVGSIAGWYTPYGANEKNAAVHVKLSFQLGPEKASPPPAPPTGGASPD